VEGGERQSAGAAARLVVEASGFVTEAFTGVALASRSATTRTVAGTAYQRGVTNVCCAVLKKRMTSASAKSC
jgi:hypothetical protein